MAAYQFDYSNPCHVYFCGIGGISMSGLAEILLKEVFRVSGSDSARSEFTEHLSAAGITSRTISIARSSPRRSGRRTRNTGHVRKRASP